MSRRGENIYKRKDGRWEARVLLPDGKYKYIYAKAYKDVKEKKKLLLEKAKDPSPDRTHASASATSVFNQWLGGPLKTRVKPSTYESYYRCIMGYIIPFYAKDQNSQITAKTVTDFSDFINNNPNISISYKRKILTIFKTALRELLNNSGEYGKILNEVSMPRITQKDVQVFTVREQRLIEKTLVQSKDKRALGILLCFYTGIRLGEVCGLKWGDLDFDAKAMVVSRTVTRIKNFDETLQKTSLTVGTPKSMHSLRKIPLPGFLIDLVLENKIEITNENCFILTGRETPLDPRSFQKLFQMVLRQAGVSNRKFHAIRHTFATGSLELGVDIKTLSEILGHSNVSITLNIYAHSLFDQKKKAIDKLNAMYILHAKTAPFAVTSSVVNA